MWRFTLSPATSSPAIPMASPTSSSPRTPSRGAWEPRRRVGRRPERFRNRLRQHLARHQVLRGQRCLAESAPTSTTPAALIESYSLNTGNTAPRGAASTIAGDKTWVVDANRKVYVYNNSGGLLGSWTAGTLATKATWRALPPTAPTCGSSMPRATRSTSTLGPRHASPAVRMRPAVSA